MNLINIKKLIRTEMAYNITILLAFLVLLYLLVSFYFVNHTFFTTSINGIDVSLKAHTELKDTVKNFINHYELQLIKRNGETEVIRGQEIGLRYNEKYSISKIVSTKNPLKWIIPIFMGQQYDVEDLFVYNDAFLEDTIHQLNCLNQEVISPQNASFKY